jgi:hypothetical protein
VLTLAYRQIASALRWSHEAQRVVVESTRAVWERGHPLLAEIADKVGGYRWQNSQWPQKLAAEVFGQRYYARSTSSIPTEQLEFSTIERGWQEQGRKPLPSYFRNFGVIDARSHVEQVKKKADEEAKRRGKRPPTGSELSGIRALSGVTRELAPELMALLDRGVLNYSVTASDVVLGQLKRDRSYRARDIYLAARVFEADFAEALAVFLHEHAHIFGHDGDRGFTDALTELIEAVVRHRDVLDRHEATWDKVRREVARERKAAGRDNGRDELHEWIDGADEGELRALLAMLSPLTLSKLRDRLGSGGTSPDGV